MSDNTDKDTEIVEVSFGISKTVQQKQFEPVKKFVNIVVATPADVTMTGAAMFALGAKMIDDAFKADGIDPSNPTEVKREIIKTGQGQKGTQLQRRQERREPPKPIERPEVVNGTPDAFEKAREHNFARVEEDPNGWKEVSTLLNGLGEDHVPKSIAHVRYLRSQKIISYKEYNLLLKWADVLQLPERSPKKSQVVNYEDVIKTQGIRSIKEAKYLRATDKLTFPEFQAVSQAFEKNGEAIFIVTA